MARLQTPAEKKADQLFRKEEKAREGVAAWKDYQAQQEATLKNMARLREARLAKEASAPRTTPAAKPKRKTTLRRG